MTTKEIRKKFLSYFESLDHKLCPSSNLVPKDDSTLLFTNAGMNQFKNIFLGAEKRDYKRATSLQKCIRAGGKHNDLDNVGFTARHHTFFEMLGNFSFGDYFKTEASAFAWEFVTKNLNLPKDRLYISVFKEDDEAFDIWNKKIGVSKDHIVRLSGADNFWRMGKSGPCGPCSEIYFDLGEEAGGDSKDNFVGGDGDRYLEFWNLVFMQFNESESGDKELLPNPSIDTGMGLERIASIVQGELSSYHTDENLKLITAIAEKAGVHYEKKIHMKDCEQHQTNVALRILSDHAKSAAFLMAEGVYPGNEGRNYVLRRIMRRAIRYGKKINKGEGIFPYAINEVISSMKEIYPELFIESQNIKQNSKDEEKKFLKTLDQGTEIFNKFLKSDVNSRSDQISGKMAFKLYDTYGFPMDLTQIMAAEHGLVVNEEEFYHQMNQAKEKTRSSWKGSAISKEDLHILSLSEKINKTFGPTKFTGYSKNLKQSGKILALSDGSQEIKKISKGQKCFLILDKTCSYAEAGGQCGDKGALLVASNGDGLAKSLDCIKKNDIYIHLIEVSEGSFNVSESCEISLDKRTKHGVNAHHSATHLLHAALRKILGDSIRQAGSLVEPQRLRFDFTYNKPATVKEIKQIENLVNKQINNSIQIEKKIMSYKEALSSGAIALFGEKYSDSVRVLEIGDFSVELCGGTHVNNTSEIKTFIIKHESGVSSGVRRIEALAENAAIDFLRVQSSELQEILTETQMRDSKGVLRKWKKFQEEIRDLKSKLKKSQSQSIDIESYFSKSLPLKIKSFSKEAFLLCEKVSISDRSSLGDLCDRLKGKIKSGVVVLVGSFEGSGESNNSCPIVVGVTKDLLDSECSFVHAGKILKKIAPLMSGSGGGRPQFAQGSVTDTTKLDEARQTIKDLLGK